MHAKVTNWAFWAITIAFVQHLILTANAIPASLNTFNRIEKRFDESDIKERYFDNKKFAFDTGQSTSKRSPIYQLEGPGRVPNAMKFNFCHNSEYCRRFVSSIGELASPLTKRAPIVSGGSTGYFFGTQCANGVCPKNRSLSSIGELFTKWKKRNPVFWVKNNTPTSYFSGASCQHVRCRRNVQMVNQEVQLKKRSPIPSNTADPTESGIDSNMGSLRRTLDDLADGMTIILLKRNLLRWWPALYRKRQELDLDEEYTQLMKRWSVPWWLNVLWPGTRRRRQESDLDEDLTRMIKRWGVPWWMNRFAPNGGGARRQELDSGGYLSSMITKRFAPPPWWITRFSPSGGGARRQELDSGEYVTSMVTKRWAPPPPAWWTRFWTGGSGTRRQELTSEEDLTTSMLEKRRRPPPWWVRFYTGSSGTRRQEVTSDEVLINLLTKRWQVPPWWIRSLSGTRKRRDGLIFDEEEVLNDQKRSDGNVKKMLFTERWNADMDTYDETFEQVKRSPVLGPLIMYWTTPIRRSLTSESENTKHQPNVFVPSSDNHRRSSKVEEERELQFTTDKSRLVKRSTEQPEGNVVRFLIKRGKKFKFGRNDPRSLDEEEAELQKREPVFGRSSNYNFGHKRRSLEETATSLEVREPVFAKENWYSFGGRDFDESAKDISKREETNFEVREPGFPKAVMYSFGGRKRDAAEPQIGKEEQPSKRTPIFAPKSSGYYRTQNNHNTKREDSNDAQERDVNKQNDNLPSIIAKREIGTELIKREGFEAQSGTEEQVNKRSPIFSPKGTGYYGTQGKKNTKRDASNDLEKRSPIFTPAGTGSAYKAMQNGTPLKGNTFE